VVKRKCIFDGFLEGEEKSRDDQLFEKRHLNFYEKTL